MMVASEISGVRTEAEKVLVQLWSLRYSVVLFAKGTARDEPSSSPSSVQVLLHVDTEAVDCDGEHRACRRVHL